MVKVLGQENNAYEAETRAMLENNGVKVQLVQITDQERLSEALHGMDVVYHLAAAQHEANIPDDRFREVNVTGTRNMLEASVNAGVQRFGPALSSSRHAWSRAWSSALPSNCIRVCGAIGSPCGPNS